MEIDEKLKRYKELYAKKYSADGISEDELAEYLKLAEQLRPASLYARNLGKEYSIFDIATLFD
jgi:hypothetical protein